MDARRLAALLLMRYDLATIRLALRLLDCRHERAIRGDRFCVDCGRSLRRVD